MTIIFLSGYKYSSTSIYLKNVIEKTLPLYNYI